ncbi:MAG: hypothetical protein C4523_17860 [Myxococcales bacterium]|nr:MAG: hypothetical protein C4523_17860 [Myxococcales bacterium]
MKRALAILALLFVSIPAWVLAEPPPPTLPLEQIVQVTHEAKHDAQGSFILLRLAPAKGYAIKPETPLEFLPSPSGSVKPAKEKYGWADVVDPKATIKELKLRYTLADSTPNQMFLGRLKVAACSATMCHIITRELRMAVK